MSKVLTLNDKIVIASNGKAILSPNAGSGGYVTQDENGYIILPPDGGGSSDTWAWYGTNAELIATDKQTIALEDTDYATWTPTTTNTTLMTPQYVVPNLDKTNYVYSCVYEFLFEPVYQTGTTLAAATLRYCSVSQYHIVLMPNSVSNWGDGDKTTVNYYSLNKNYMKYITTSSQTAITSSAPYGVYSTTPSHSATTSLTTLTFKFPIYARCYVSYFSTDMAAAIDQNKSTFTYRYSIYRTPHNRSMGDGMTDALINIYQNGIS